jgi:hypothetical protein
MGQHLSDVFTSSVTGVRYSYSGSSSTTASAPNASTSASGRLPQLHETASGNSQQQQHAQMQQLTPAAVAVGRGALVSWLRCVLDLLAALMLVDPGALLNELSHNLAGGAGSSRPNIHTCTKCVDVTVSRAVLHCILCIDCAATIACS